VPKLAVLKAKVNLQGRFDFRYCVHKGPRQSAALSLEVLLPVPGFLFVSPSLSFTYQMAQDRSVSSLCSMFIEKDALPGSKCDLAAKNRDR